jgi:nicotinamidase-related amidase
VGQANRVLVIVDMQREFVDEDGLCYFPLFRTVIESIAKLLEQARARGIPIIFVRTAWRADGSDVATHTGGAHELRQRGMRENSRGTEIIPELAPVPSDYIVVKKRYSAFYMTDMELLLRGLHVREVIFAGCATNFCVRASVEDAANRDFDPVVLSDCVAGTSDEGHRQSLNDIQAGFGRVMTSKEFLTTLE